MTALAMTAAASIEAVMTAAMTAAVLTVVASTVPDLHELRSPRCGDEPEERRVGVLVLRWQHRTPGRLERR